MPPTKDKKNGDEFEETDLQNNKDHYDFYSNLSEYQNELLI